MPFYFDYDRSISVDEAVFKNDQKDHNQRKSKYIITQQEFEKICSLTHSLEHYQGSAHGKNEKLLDLMQIHKRIMVDPNNLFFMKINKHKKENHISHCLELLRAFQGFDLF